jgi:5'-3' exonuclease
MGIPWYFYTIYKKYNIENDLVIDEKSISTSNIDYLYLDYNSMIHPCAQQTLNSIDTSITDTGIIEDTIIKNCLDYTRYILNVVKPKNIYIMIDGVAPRAKMNQQRERRYKSHFFKQIERNENENKPVWNSNKITPGTNFMNKLIKRLRDFKSQISNNYIVFISDSNEPGEGEHKMMKHISDLGCDDKICIYGLDADLIMLSLINVNYDKIVLIRDNTFNSKLLEKDKVYTYLDIKKLRQYICKDVKQNIKKQINDRNLIYDYIFLCFLLGNDFVEHIPSLMIKEGGIDVLLKYYCQLLNTKDYYGIVNLNELDSKNIDKSINLFFLKDLFYHLSKTEDYFFTNVYSAYKHNRSVYKDTFDLESINVNSNNIYVYKDDFIKYNTSGYKDRYYKFYDIQDINLICKNYIRSLYWILGYYNGHCHENWDWYYDHYATPFVSDLFSYLSYNNNNNVLRNIKFKKTKPVSTLEQLFMVLPKDSLLEIVNSIDDDLYKKMTRIFNTKDINVYYPNQICLDMINKQYLWQSKIFLKTFNNEIINIFL